MKRPFLKRLHDELEATFAAAAFAEEDDAETARELLSPTAGAGPSGGSTRR